MRALSAINKANMKRGCFLLILIFLYSMPARLQEPAPPARNYVRWAQEFLVSFYPELTGKGYTASLESSFGYDVPMNENSAFELYVGRGPRRMLLGYLGGYEPATPPKKPPKAGPVYPEQLLSSSFQFQNEKLLTFGASGASIGNPEKAEQVSNNVLTHPEVTDAEAAAILKEAGAKYGPWNKDEFSKQLPMESLQRFLGPLRVISVEFPVLDENGARPRWPEWHVVTRRSREASDQGTYELWFEPFKGDLVRVSAVAGEAGPNR